MRYDELAQTMEDTAAGMRHEGWLKGLLGTLADGLSYHPELYVTTTANSFS